MNNCNVQATSTFLHDWLATDKLPFQIFKSLQNTALREKVGENIKDKSKKSEVAVHVQYSRH